MLGWSACSPSQHRPNDLWKWNSETLAYGTDELFSTRELMAGTAFGNLAAGADGRVSGFGWIRKSSGLKLTSAYTPASDILGKIGEV